MLLDITRTFIGQAILVSHRQDIIVVCDVSNFIIIIVFSGTPLLFEGGGGKAMAMGNNLKKKGGDKKKINIYIILGINLWLRLSGHMLLHILSSFTYQIMTSGITLFFVGLVPLAFIIAFSGLELAIALIQSQVFVVLSSSYIKDGLDLH